MAPKKPARKKSVVKKSAGKKPAAKLAAKPAMKAGAKKVVKKAAKPAAKKPAAPKQTVAAKPKPKKRTFPAVVHWEIQAVDAAKQQAFFASLFDWPVDANNAVNYGMVAAGGDGAIGGGIGGTRDAIARTTFYVEVPDINATLAKAEGLGATMVMPRTDAGMVIMAQFRDLEGNLVGLVEGDGTN